MGPFGHAKQVALKKLSIIHSPYNQPHPPTKKFQLSKYSD
jgi:hypothetical protein